MWFCFDLVKRVLKSKVQIKVRGCLLDNCYFLELSCLSPHSSVSLWGTPFGLPFNVQSKAPLTEAEWGSISRPHTKVQLNGYSKWMLCSTGLQWMAQPIRREEVQQVFGLFIWRGPCPLDSVWIIAGSFVSAFISALKKRRRLKEHRRGNQRVKSEPSSPWDSTGRELDTGRPIHGFILLL